MIANNLKYTDTLMEFWGVRSTLLSQFELMAHQIQNNKDIPDSFPLIPIKLFVVGIYNICFYFGKKQNKYSFLLKTTDISKCTDLELERACFIIY